jgi:hypothetical protein
LGCGGKVALRCGGKEGGIKFWERLEGRGEERGRCNGEGR